MGNDQYIDYKACYDELCTHLEYGHEVGSSATAQHFLLQSQLHHIYQVKRLFDALMKEVKQGLSMERWLAINIDHDCLTGPIHYGMERSQIVKDEGGIEPVQIQTSYLSDSLYHHMEKQVVDDYIQKLNSVLWSPVHNFLLYEQTRAEMEALKEEIRQICSLLRENLTNKECVQLYDYEYNLHKELLGEKVEEDFEKWEVYHEGEELASYVKGKIGWEMRALFSEGVFTGHPDEDMHRYKAEMVEMFHSYDETIYLSYAELRNYFQLKEGQLEPKKEKISKYLFKHRVWLTAHKREQLFYFILFSERLYQVLQKEKPLVEKEVLKKIIQLLKQYPDYLNTSAQWALVYVYCRKCFQLKMSVSAFEQYVEKELPENFEKRCKASTVQKATKRSSWENDKRSAWSEPDINLVDFLNEKLPYAQKWQE